MDIFPVINCPEESCFRERMKVVEDLPFKGSKVVHIDVSDEVFADSSTWINAVRLKEFASEGIEFTVHLMFESPDLVLKWWLFEGVKEIVIHTESDFDPELVIEACKKNGTIVSLAANPGTSISSLVRQKDRFSRFLLLAVNPGPAGQSMSSEVIPRIKELRAALPGAIIEVDGGVRPETVRLMKEAGADIAVAGSYIFNAEDPAEAYLELISAAGE